MKPIASPIRNTTAKWIGSMPNWAAIGARIGAKMIVFGRLSRMVPASRTMSMHMNRTA